MERRINKKTEDYLASFKNDIRERASEIGITPEMNVLLQYVYDYKRLEFGKDDLTRRKRVKNAVPLFERCCANKANGDQCTRRKKEVNEYCGTHMKGTPHGVIVCGASTTVNKKPNQQIEVWAQDVRGIIYYMDKNCNVYQPEDIVSNKKNPRIIAKCTKIGDTYSIPAVNISRVVQPYRVE